MKGFKVESAPTSKTVYDIEVEDNHSFLAGKVFTHNCGIFIAKKRYFIRLRDNEGERFPEDEPYIKKMGIEIIKSSTPEFSKKHLTEVIPVLLDKEISEVRTWLNDVRGQYKESAIVDISKTTSVSKVQCDTWGTIKDGRKVSIPNNSRAALSTNNYISANNLETKYNLINGGDKIKITCMHMPNPLNSNVIAFTDPKLAEEFRGYVDFDSNYDKWFMSPLEIMVKPLGWDLRKNTASLDDW